MKRFLIALMCVAVVFCYVPTIVFADQAVSAVQEQSENLADSEETEQNVAPTPQAGTGEGRGGLSLTAPAVAQDIYVSGSGSDENGDGRVGNPYATLAKAAEVVNQEPDTGKAFIIHVVSDLTAAACARFYDHAVTIVGEGETPPTVSREESFATQQDAARGTYNPAMIEIQTTNAPASLTFRNIILDDHGRHEGSVFAQAVSQGENGGDAPNNGTYVQDAIIASNATQACTITLGAGTVLRNYGGMSAVRVTNQAVLKMEAGSAMEDTTVTDRTKGSAEGEVGPAGAVWTQGGALLMEAGAEIRNMVGRAIYADGGNITIGGKIHNITGDANMWQGNLKQKTLPGVALHLRNGAVGSMSATGEITDIKGRGNAVFATGEAVRFTMEHGSKIHDFANLCGVYMVYGKLYMDGEISKLSEAVAVSLNDGAAGEIKSNGFIHDNQCATAVVYLRGGSQLTIRGKINDNESTGNCAAVYIVTNGGASHATLEADGEICGNINGGKKYGAAVDLQQDVCSFTMNGGKITGNKGPLGAVQIHKNQAALIMNGGEISGNVLSEKPNGNADANVYLNGGEPKAILNAGILQSITIAHNVRSTLANGNVYISDQFNLLGGNVKMLKDNKTLTPAPDSLNLKLGNASAESDKALTDISDSYGWSNLHATYWMQRDGAARRTVGGLTLAAEAPQIVYAIVIPVDENGKPETAAEIQGDASRAARARIHHTNITESGIEVTIPEGHPNGYAVALVQPTKDLGSLLITTSKAQLDYDKDKTADGTYEVPYTASYAMSDSLRNLFKEAGTLDNPNLTFTLTLELDKRLRIKDVSDCKFTSPIFKAEAFTISGDGYAVTVTCKLKADWRNHLEKLVKTPMVFTGTGVLNGADFAAGEFLSTSGNVQMTIPRGGSEMYPIYIPGNVCQTKMVKEEAPIGPIGPIGPVTTYYTIKAAAGEGGSIAPNGYIAVSAGSDKSFTIAAAEGYEIKDVLVDGVSVGAVSDYTFKNVWKNHTIDAVFRAKAEDPETPDKPANSEKPSKPETPDKPTEPEDKSKVPKTGDDSVLAGSALLLLLSACGLAAVLRKREEK